MGILKAGELQSCRSVPQPARAFGFGSRVRIPAFRSKHADSAIGPGVDDGTVSVAVIDGPYDAAALSKILAQPPANLGRASCSVEPNSACDHGTFIMGLLGAREDLAKPGLCPGCKLLHVPLFIDERGPSASVGALSNAIAVAVLSGAKLINLSLAIMGENSRSRELAAALDLAEASGAVILAAAGNQSRLAMGQLISHPVTIPVVAVDAAQRILPDCNFGPAISRRGVAALGHQVLGYAPGGKPAVMSGTSVATAVATGIIAELWSAHPEASGQHIRAAITRLGPRDGSRPPILDRTDLSAALNQIGDIAFAASSSVQSTKSIYARLQGDTVMTDANVLATSANRTAGLSGSSANVVTPAHGAGGCACGAPNGVCTCENTGSSSARFIYVLGTVDIRFPNQSISEEMQSVAHTLGIHQGNDEPLRSWYHKVLSHKTGEVLTARHLARLLCWIVKVEGQIAYYLSLRDLHDLDDLINCLGRPEFSEDGKHHNDLDLVVGSSSLVAVEKAPGVIAPVLSVDQLCFFEEKELLDELFKPTPKQKGSSGASSNPSRPDRIRFFRRLVQSADNFGDTDEWRALNYLAVRYKPIYLKYAEMKAANYDLESVKVLNSRLWRDKQIVDPVFAFRNKQTGVVEKWFVRLNVSYLYPMIVTELSEYFDR